MSNKKAQSKLQMAIVESAIADSKLQRRTRLKQQRDEVKALQDELSAMLENAQNQQYTLEVEFRDKQEKRNKKLNLIIEEARDNYEAIYQQHMQEIREKRELLDQLNVQATRMLEHMPKEKIEEARKQLRDLIRKGTLKQKALEEEQRKIGEQARLELNNLVKTAYERQAKLHHQHKEEIRKQLETIEQEVNAQVDRVRKGYKDLKREEKQALDAIYMQAHEQYARQQEQCDQIMHQNEADIAACTREIAILLKEGQHESVAIRLNELKVRMQEEVRRLEASQNNTERAINAEIIDLNIDIQKSSSKLRQACDAELKKARGLLQQHTHDFMRRISRETVDRMSQDIFHMEVSMDAHRKMLKTEQIQRIEHVKRRMAKQAGDNKRRRYREQKELLRMTERNIADITRHYKNATESAHEDLNSVMQATKKRVDYISQEHKKHISSFKEKQSDMFASHMRAFHASVSEHQLDEEHNKEQKRKKLIEEKIAIGKSASRTQQYIQNRQSMISSEGRREIVGISASQRERLANIQQEYNDTIKETKRKNKTLRHTLEAEEEVIRAKYAAMLKEAKEQHQIALQGLNQERDHLKQHENRIRLLKKQLNQYKIQMQETASQELRDDYLALKELIRDAYCKYDAMQRQLEQSHAAIFSTLDMRRQTIQDERSEQLDEIQRQFAEQRRVLNAEADSKLSALRVEEERLMQKINHVIGEKYQEMNEKQLDMVQMQKQVTDQAQTRLQELNQEARHL